jgi:hypothetical protein
LCFNCASAPSGRAPGERSASIAATVFTPWTLSLSPSPIACASLGFEKVATDKTAAMAMPIMPAVVRRPRRDALAVGAPITGIAARSVHSMARSPA